MDKIFKFEMGQDVWERATWTTSKPKKITIGARIHYEVASLKPRNFYKDLFDLKSETEYLEENLFVSEREAIDNIKY